MHHLHYIFAMININFNYFTVFILQHQGNVAAYITEDKT